MKKEKKDGSVNTKVILSLLILAAVILVIVVIVVNVSKGKGQGGSASSDGDITGSAIEGSENVKKNGDVKTNVSKALKDDKRYGIYTLSDISIESVNGLGKLTAMVSANTSERVEGKVVRVQFLDKSGNVLGDMAAYIPQINAGEKKKLEAKSTTDFANIYDFKIVDEI